MAEDPAPPSHGPGAASPPGACVHCPRRVVTIHAKVPTTQSVKGTWRTPPPMVFHEFSSSSANQGLDSNHPIVLVRNCGTIQLEAVTDPPRQSDVAWTVLPNPGPAPNPTLSRRSGLHSELTTNVAGGYAVSVTLEGTTVFWNVVFVDVEVWDSKVRTGRRFERRLKWQRGSYQQRGFRHH